MDRLEYSVGRFTLRPHRQLLDDGVPISIGRKALGLLTVLVEADGALVTKDELMAAVWPNAIVEDNAIQVHIGALRKALGPDAALLGTVHGLGYRLAATTAAGTPGMGVLAPPPSEPSVAGPVEPLLAVLAFDNLCEAADMAWFTDGVSEEIQHTVARTTKMQVIGRGSSFQFRGVDKAAAHVGAELNATHVLDGSVRRSGQRVRISAQLVECAKATTLWSERFDRDLSDTFALQDEIAAAVAAALKIVFSPPTRPEPVDPAAYDLYLKARALAFTESLADGVERMVRALGLMEKAVALAPAFARAWTSLARARAACLRIFDPALFPGLRREMVVSAAETALRLDPGSGSAYLALALLEPWGLYLERQALFRKALAAAPNDPGVLTDMGIMISTVGRLHESFGYLKQARDLDPLDGGAANLYAVMLSAIEGDEVSRPLWDELLARWPDSEFITLNALSSAALQNDWAWFEALVQASAERGQDSRYLRRRVRHLRNRRSPDPRYVGRYLQSVREQLARSGTLPLQDLVGLSELGLTDETFQLIDQASFDHMFDPDGPAPAGSGVIPGAIFLQHSKTMIADIRFVGLCAKLGLCDYWVKTDRWPDCADQVPYDFRAEARRLAGAHA